MIAHFGLKRQYNNLKDELLDATHRALKDGQLMGGQFTRTFEEWLRQRTSAKYAITVHSGTQALEIIAKYKFLLYKENIPSITIPNVSYPATLNAFLNTGWKVKLCDTDKYGIASRGQTYDSSHICLVGLYGRKPWEQARIENSSSIIVDGAQHWLVADGQVGAGMAISFDPTKNLNASGNGGAIVTNDEHLYLYALKYRDNFKPYFDNEGTNSKMSEQDCAQLLVRTKYLNDWQKRRKEISDYYCSKFNDLPLHCLTDGPTPHAYQKFVIYFENRNLLHTHLITSGIESKIHYEYTLGDLPIAKDLEKPDLLSKSVMLSRGVLSLPIYPELTDSEVEFIASKVKDFYKVA